MKQTPDERWIVDPGQAPGRDGKRGRPAIDYHGQPCCIHCAQVLPTMRSPYCGAHRLRARADSLAARREAAALRDRAARLAKGANRPASSVYTIAGAAASATGLTMTDDVARDLSAALERLARTTVVALGVLDHPDTDADAGKDAHEALAAITADAAALIPHRHPDLLRLTPATSAPAWVASACPTRPTEC